MRIYASDSQLATKTIKASKDAHINSYFDDTNYGTSHFMYLGYDSTGPQKKRALYGFDLSAIPTDAVITEAKLYLYQYSGVSTDDSITFDIYRVMGAWAENAVTWNNRPTVEAVPTVAGLVCAKTAANVWRSWTVTALVIEMIAESADSMQLQLQDESGTYIEQAFYTKDHNDANAPYIEVTYKSPVSLATNGTGNILCESAIVHEEINGEFSMTLKVAQGSDHLDTVGIGAIVKADTPRGAQFFRLSKPIMTLDGGKEVFAWHISYDLAQDMILNRAWTGKTGEEALPDILQAGISETRFTGSSDIDLVTNMRIVRTSVLGAVMGEQDNSFVNRWGGEVERDNFTVNVLSRLGADKGVVVEYRKNLTGLVYEEDDAEIANRIIPTGLEENDTVIMLPEVYIDSELIDETPVPHVRHIHFSDIKVGKKDEDDNILYPDAASVIDELRIRVAQMYEQGVDLPFKSATVEFIDLSQTEEYKNFAVLQTLEIGDTVKCKYKTTLLTKRVVSYDYDALTKKYIRVVLGSIVPLLGDTLWAQDLDLSALKTSVAGKLTEGQTYNDVYINHEDGFVAVAEIGGKTVTVKQNGQDGFAFYVDGVYKGGLALINGEVGFVGNILTNDIDGDCYAVIGEVDVGGTNTPGILVYNKNVSTTEPAFSIVAAVYTSGGVVAGSAVRLIVNGGPQFWLSPASLIGTRLLDKNDINRLVITDSDTHISSPDGTKRVGADNTGAYKYAGGSKTYL